MVVGYFSVSWAVMGHYEVMLSLLHHPFSPCNKNRPGSEIEHLKLVKRENFSWPEINGGFSRVGSS